VVKSDWQPVTGRPVALENCCALKLIFWTKVLWIQN
jgi:hypothetical protein